MQTRYKITAAHVLEAVILLFLAVLLIASRDLPERSKRLPVLVAWVTVALVAGDIVRSFIRQRRASKESRGEAGSESDLAHRIEWPIFLRVLGSIGFMAVTIVCWYLLGYVFTSIVVAIGFSLFLGSRKKITVVVSSVVVTLLLYVFFQILLQIRLPAGLLYTSFFGG